MANNSNSGACCVAASDAPGECKRCADHVCEGTDDNRVIQAAIDQLTTDN